MLITLWAWLAISAAAVQLVWKRRKHGVTTETILTPSTLIVTAMVLAGWPMLIALWALEKTIGPFLPNPNYADVVRADSLRAAPGHSNVPRGANTSLSPDQL